MKEERGTEDIWLCLIGVAAILGACGMTFDILFDMLLSVGSAGVAVGLGGSAESPQLTLLVYGALFFKPLFGVAMFVGGLFSILCSCAKGWRNARSRYITTLICAAAGGVGVLGALVTAIVIAYFLSLPLPLPWEGCALVFEMICEFLLILAALRAKKRAEALKGVADWYEIKGAKLIEANLWLENGKRDRKAKKKEAGI